MKSPASDVSLRALTAQIISAYVSNNEIEGDELMALIKSVHLVIMALARKENEEAKPVPAVHPKKSVFPDFIICLEDGKKLKLLRRHLHTVYKMTPQQYRSGGIFRPNIRWSHRITLIIALNLRDVLVWAIAANRHRRRLLKTRRRTSNIVPESFSPRPSHGGELQHSCNVRWWKLPTGRVTLCWRQFLANGMNSDTISFVHTRLAESRSDTQCHPGTSQL